MNFLETPAKFTRSQRCSQTPAEYACAVETPCRPTGFTPAWWIAMTIVSVAGGLVIIFFSSPT